MSEKLRIFDKPLFDNSISKVEERTYYPHIKSFGYNDEIEIEIKDRDALICPADSYLCVEGTFTPEAKGEGVCSLQNNAGLFLFDSISYDLNGKEIDKVRDPGLMSTIYGYIGYNEMESKRLTLAGWNPTNIVLDTTDGTNFWFRIPLSFIFGVFRDHRQVIIGHHKIRLIRSRNDKNAYVVRMGTTKSASILIKNISLKMKHIFPNDDEKILLLKRMQTDRALSIGFRKWDIFEWPQLHVGGKKEIWNVKTSTTLERPRFVILAFQTDIKDNATKDSTTFDHINLRNYRVWLGSNMYPHESHDLDFTKKQYLSAYQAYVDLCGIFNDGNYSSSPQNNYVEFKLKPLFVIDCSKQDESLRSSAIDVKVEFESDTPFPEKTRVICIIVHDKVFTYTPLSGNVRELI